MSVQYVVQRAYSQDGADRGYWWPEDVLSTLDSAKAVSKRRREQDARYLYRVVKRTVTDEILEI